MRERLRAMSRLGRWAFWLGIATVAWGLVIPALVGPLTGMLPDGERDALALPFGLDPVAPGIALAIAALVVGMAAQRQGERSQLLLAAFVPGAVWRRAGLAGCLCWAGSLPPCCPSSRCFRTRGAISIQLHVP